MACLSLRDADEPLPAAQILIYPNTDLTLSQPSVKEKGTGYALDDDFLAWAVRQWAPGPDRTRLSPLHVSDLRGLPAALIVTAEHDALRDEGEAYARRLAEAGVPVTHRREPGLAHGFAQNADLESDAATGRLFTDTRALLATCSPPPDSGDGLRRLGLSAPGQAPEARRPRTARTPP
jgi:acetyl esterase